jgi:hypothetical protein
MVGIDVCYFNSFIPCFHVIILFDSMYLFLAMFWSGLIGCLCSFLQAILIFRSRGEAGHGIPKENYSTTGSSVTVHSHRVTSMDGRMEIQLCYLFSVWLSHEYYSYTSIHHVFWFYNLDVLLHPAVISSLAHYFWYGGFFISKKLYCHPTSYGWHQISSC